MYVRARARSEWRGVGEGLAEAGAAEDLWRWRGARGPRVRLQSRAREVLPVRGLVSVSTKKKPRVLFKLGEGDCRSAWEQKWQKN